MKLNNFWYDEPSLIQRDNYKTNVKAKINQILYSPMKNELVFDLTVVGKTYTGSERVWRGYGRRNYRVQIMFNSVFEIKDIKSADEAEYYLSKKGEKYMLVKDSTGHNHIVEKPKRSKKNNAQVRCNCESYEFTYNYANKRKGGALPPDFPHYQRKTPVGGRYEYAGKVKYKVGRPRRNPLKLPGMCKHVVEATIFLEKNGYLID